MVASSDKMIMELSIVDMVCQKCYILVGGEAYASEKSTNQRRTGKTLVSCHRAVGKQGRCLPFSKGARPRERGVGDRGGHSAIRICREKGTDVHEDKSVETS